MTKILLLNDDPVQLRFLYNAIKTENRTIYSFQDPLLALKEISTLPELDLIVTDLHMDELDGWRFCRILRSPEYPVYNNKPILVTSATFAGDDPQSITVESGANAFLASPFTKKELNSQIRKLLAGESLIQKAKLLFADKSETFCQRMTQFFEQNSFDVSCVHSPDILHQQINTIIPDIVVIDHQQDNVDIHDVLRALKKTRNAPLLFVTTSSSAPGLAAGFLKMGAYGFIKKPFDPEYLLQLIRKALRERSLLRIEERLEEKTEFLRISAEKYSTIFEHIPGFFFRCDLNRNIEELTPFASELLKGQISDFMGKPLDFIFDNPNSAQFLEKNVFEQKNVHNMESQLRCRNGEKVDVLVNAKLIFTPKGVPQYIDGIITDISTQKALETELKKSINEREYLLKEVHHRVKNNLSIIISLIDLVSFSKDPNEQVDARWKELSDKVRSIGMIHDKLYQSDSLKTINFGEYLHELTDAILFSFSSFPIPLKIECDDLDLSLEKSIPLGLITVEIITNAIKYGLYYNPETGKTTGTLSINLIKSGDSNYILTISNTGKPFPPEQMKATPETLGMNLIHHLVDQINGDYTLDIEGKTEYKITFPGTSQPLSQSKLL